MGASAEIKWTRAPQRLLPQNTAPWEPAGYLSPPPGLSKAP